MTFDLVIAKTTKEAKHALIDWDLEDGDSSQILIVTQYEILEGLDPSGWRLHFVGSAPEAIVKAIEAACTSRGVSMQNITVRKYDTIDDGYQVR